MHIAHVTATFPPYLGGTGNVCYHNARELARRGYTVHVVTCGMPGVPDNEVTYGVHVKRLRPLVQIGNAPVIPGLTRSLRGFDVIHLHYPFILGAEMAGMASVLYRTPLVISFHNDLTGDGARRPVFSLYQRLSAFLTIRKASRLCAVSMDHYETSALSRLLSNRHEFAIEVPNGVDAGCFCQSGPAVDLSRLYNAPPDSRVVLFVAALDRAHHFKGLGTLLRAVRRLPPDVWLLVVGDGGERSGYESEAYKLGIADRAIFVGAVDHERTPQFFRSADVTVLPSSPPESFGLVLIESMACGTPVVARRIPGVRKVVDHGIDGLLIDAGDPMLLAGAIQDILSDDARRQAMGRRGRAKVEAHYTWEKIGDRLEQVYAQLLERPKVHPLQGANSQW